MKSKYLFFQILPAVMLLASAAQAAETKPAKYPGLKNLQLVTGVDAVVPGQDFTVGLWFQHENAYHTYWKSPGIVGVPAIVKWKDLPEGFEPGEIQWPAPQKTLMATLTAWGYETDTCLLIPMKVPGDLGDRKSVTLQGSIGWMCCATSCHPGSHDFSLTLPVKASAEPDARWREQFEKSRKRFPEAAPEGWTFAAREIDGRTIQLEVRGPDEVDWSKVYFFCYDNQVDSDESQLIAILPDSKGAVFTFARPEFAPKHPAELAGVLRYEKGWPSLKGHPWMIASAPWPGYEGGANDAQDSDTPKDADKKPEG